MLDTLEKYSARPVTADATERARTTLLKGIELTLNQSSRVGIELSEWAAMGDWRMLFYQRDRQATRNPSIQEIARMQVKIPGKLDVHQDRKIKRIWWASFIDMEGTRHQDHPVLDEHPADLPRSSSGGRDHGSASSRGQRWPLSARHRREPPTCDEPHRHQHRQAVARHD